jgi:hypothetical protein
MNQPVTTDEIRQLLLTYEHALDAADSLPSVVRIASRPRRWTVLEPLRRTPHLTVGSATMVLYHVQRSTAVLARRYARIAATRGLADEERRSAELVTSFRESLPGIRWRFIVPSAALAIIIAVRLFLREIPSDLSPLALGLSHALKLTDLQRRQLSHDVDHLASAMTFDASSITGILDEIDNANGAELVVLTVVLLGAAYVIFRPLSSAFRIKRLVFNLATNAAVNVQCTTTTWNSVRSTGLYELERDLFGRLGGRPPHEIDLDLWVSAAGAVFPAWLLVSYYSEDLKDYPYNRGFDVAILGIVVGLATCRGIWLLRTARARRRKIDRSDPPAGLVVPNASQLVETRSVLETASLAGIFAIFAIFAIFLLPSPIWVRLVRERRDLIWGQKRTQGQSPRGLRAGGLWPALGSAILLVIVPPLPIALHLRQLGRLRTSSARRPGSTPWWTVPLIPAATAFLIFELTSPEPALETTVTWSGISLLTLAAAYFVTMGRIQRQQNLVIRALGTPRPDDDPNWGAGARSKSSDKPTPRRDLLNGGTADPAVKDDSVALHMPPDVRRPPLY